MVVLVVVMNNIIVIIVILLVLLVLVLSLPLSLPTSLHKNTISTINSISINSINSINVNRYTSSTSLKVSTLPPYVKSKTSNSNSNNNNNNNSNNSNRISSSISSSQLLSSSTTTSIPLPWLSSLKSDRKLVYMPFLENQLTLLKANGFVEDHVDERFVYSSSSIKPARIGNILFSNKNFRKVRLTYFDAGDAVQVFNSLWYPSYEYDIPLFGVDLISLNKNRVLSVVDYQPLHPTKEYSEKYIDHMKPIRDKYIDLQGQLSGKIYDDTSFFSSQMLFGRFGDEDKLESVVLPAYTEYLHGYLDLMNNAIPDKSIDSINRVEQRQQAYDKYSAIKDPAVGLFDAYFGKEWSQAFVHDYLFTLSDDPRKIPLHVDSTEQPVHQFKITGSNSISISDTKK